ncbi:unnamed protein product [Parnassius apollo]|uniref:(apollo) hypothetical protein n=1 Tax=Parnassius apollo TaxID=110799 RepID=A0A8S3WK32_PARAO|nr:unnamed protein product [Parnassius apollo]
MAVNSGLNEECIYLIANQESSDEDEMVNRGLFTGEFDYESDMLQKIFVKGMWLVAAQANVDVEISSSDDVCDLKRSISGFENTRQNKGSECAKSYLRERKQ